MAVVKHNFEKPEKSCLHIVLDMRVAYLTIVALLTLFVQVGEAAAVVTCVKVDSCTCKFDDGSGDVISLKTLANQDGTPRFNFSQATADKYLYAYNPCNTFSWHPECQNVAVCQSSSNGKDVFSTGTQESAKFNPEGSLITYSAEVNGITRTTELTLRCDQSATEPVFNVYGEIHNQPQHYGITLTSNCACKNGCLSGGISVGSVLCILFSVGVVLYVVGGVLFLKFVQGAEGLALIPNVEFWKDLPMLIKDGVLFLARGCKTEDSSYDQI